MDIETMSEHLEHQYKNNPPTRPKKCISASRCLARSVCACLEKFVSVSKHCELDHHKRVLINMHLQAEEYVLLFECLSNRRAYHNCKYSKLVETFDKCSALKSVRAL